MTTKLLFFVSFFLVTLSFAQIKISGRVTYKNKGIGAVNVTLKDTYDGATTGTDGHFSFETSEKGDHTLVFTHPKYTTVEKNIPAGDQDLVVDAEMKEQVGEIDAVVISAGSIEASDRKRATAALTPMDIYTTAGSQGQTTTGYKFLPGVQNAGDSEGLFVRGGTGAETKFYIDGNLVNNYFSSSVPGLAGRERFNTSIFKGSVFSSGGYSALYGQALSSVLLLESVDMPDETSYSFSLFPFSLGGDYQHLNEKKTFSYGIDASISDLGLVTKVLNFETDFIKAPRNVSVNGNFRIKTKSGGFLKYYGSFDTNSLTVSQPSLEQNYDEQQPAVNGKNTFHSLTYKKKMGRYLMNLGSSFSINKNDLEIGIINAGNRLGNVNMNTEGLYWNSRAVFERKIAAVSNIKAGFELLSENDKTSFSVLDAPQQENTVHNFTSALFAETNLAFGRNFSASFGIRTENSGVLNQWNLAPRFSAAYRLSEKWVTSLAYGIFYQTPEAKYLTQSFKQDFQKATHYIFQIQRSEENRTLRMEAFYKNYKNLVKTSASGFRNIVLPGYGNGFAKGVEVLWRDKKSIKNVDYWISYSYLDSKREFLNYPTELYPSFAAKHNISLVAKKFVTPWKTGFNFSYTYTSGRPFYNIIAQNGENVLKSEGKVKDFNSLNFSLNYLPNLGKKDAKAFTILVAGINNLLGNKNIYGYRFSSNGQMSAPVLPAAQTFVYIGALISFGIDKTQEAIDNNL
ncbi:carboxypeptidase-like regulatory domain-containing protein [uncultured Chryseobacterium sp.]|uniref:TonB-dependent receptor n=1 Tax=uncultured Chryseobacterium sp. TaxID=259322 RepID=UPI0025FA494B|nr:carboxypeptidase-like regulatory domain-containing protein [uncultured Chryseobacterium sp.]